VTVSVAWLAAARTTPGTRRNACSSGATLARSAAADREGHSRLAAVVAAARTS